jgi:hypothetical protein
MRITEPTALFGACSEVDPFPTPIAPSNGIWTFILSDVALEGACDGIDEDSLEGAELFTHIRTFEDGGIAIQIEELATLGYLRGSTFSTSFHPPEGGGDTPVAIDCGTETSDGWEADEDCGTATDPGSSDPTRRMTLEMDGAFTSSTNLDAVMLFSAKNEEIRCSFEADIIGFFEGPGDHRDPKPTPDPEPVEPVEG